MKQFFLSVIFILNVFQLFSQAPGVEWQHCLGGSNNEAAVDVKPTSDNGVVVVCFTNSHDGDVAINPPKGLYDFWLVKLDSLGAIIWQHCFGGFDNEFPASVVETSDHGFIISGYSASTDTNVIGNHGLSDYWIVKTDSLGQIQWQQCYGGTSTELSRAIIQTKDSGYMVVGQTHSNNGNVTSIQGAQDAWIVKLKNSGAILWQKSIGGMFTDEAKDVTETFDHKYAFVGFANNDTLSPTVPLNAWMVMLDDTGKVLWQKYYGGSAEDKFYSIHQTKDSGYIVCGLSKSTDGDLTGIHSNNSSLDYWVLKLDSTGTIIWQKCFGGTADDFGMSVIQTKDGGYIVSGTSYSNDGDVTITHGQQDGFLVKLDSSGALLWKKCLGGTGQDEIGPIQQTKDEGYLVAGIAGSNDGDVIGFHPGFYPDAWVVKLYKDSNIVSSDIQQLENLIHLTPTHDHIYIHSSSNTNLSGSFEITDVVGKIKSIGKIQDETININFLEPGIYFLKIDSNGRVGKWKFLVVE